MRRRRRSDGGLIDGFPRRLVEEPDQSGDIRAFWDERRAWEEVRDQALPFVSNAAPDEPFNPRAV